MNLRRIAALPVAAVFLFLPSLSRAQKGVLSSETPGVVVLPDPLDSHKLASGATVTTELTHTVKLPNGVEIPKGSQLVAVVSADDMNIAGANKLALRFTEAHLKHGKTIPIKATILNVNTQMTAVANNTTTIEAFMETPANLNNQPDQTQQDGVVSGVSLYSDATSANSGVFVTSKNAIKLPRGSKMELALAPGTGGM